MRGLVIIAMATASTGAAHAADLSVVVRTAKGAPVANAVVLVTPAGGGAAPARYDAPLRVSQADLQFDPFVLIVPLGAEVAFPNQDHVRHHVYSFSPAKSFELKLYGHGAAPTVRFDKPGVVALGCNIHDRMTAFLRVTDAPYAARTDASGRAILSGLPAGAATVTLWHPYLKAKGGELTERVTAPASGRFEKAYTVALRTPAMRLNGY